MACYQPSHANGYACGGNGHHANIKREGHLVESGSLLAECSHEVGAKSETDNAVNNRGESENRSPAYHGMLTHMHLSSREDTYVRFASACLRELKDFSDV